MPFIPSLARSEIARFRRSRATKIVLVAIAIVPLIYAGALVWSNVDPTHHLNAVPAAIVNADEPVTSQDADGNDQTVALGRLVTANLVGDDSDTNFDWTLTSADDAEEGLHDGRFLAVLTVPEDFSARAVSTGGDDPEAAEAAAMTVTTNDGANFIVGNIANLVMEKVAATTSQTVSEQYLDRIYLGFNDLSDQVSSAADGADQLSSGASELDDGTTDLVDGANELASGATSLSSGLVSLDEAAGKLSSGASDLDSGVSTLASGAGKLSSGADDLASGTSSLRSQTKDLPSQTAALATGAGAVDDGANAALDGASQAQAGLETLATGSGSVDSGVTAYTQGVDALATNCTALGGSPALCTQLTALSSQSAALRTGASGVADGAADAATSLGDLVAGLGQLTAGTAELSAGTTTLAQQTPALVSGIAELDDGASDLAAASGTLSSGASALSTGSAELADGSDQLASGADSAADGARTLASGTGELRDGTEQLSSGASDLASGSESLASGLAKGADQIPTYTESQRSHLSSVAAAPVGGTADRLHEVPGYGYGLAPYFMALALWVGAMAVYMVLRALPARAIAAAAPAWRVALAGYLPGALLALVQVALMIAVLVFGIGISPARTGALVLLALLTSAAFLAINQALVALWGTKGRFAALILIVLQLASAGATYPIQTAPEFFQILHPWLPMTHAVEAFRSLIAGGSLGVGTAVASLLVWLAVGLALSIVAARRRRRWTVSRLHPAVSI